MAGFPNVDGESSGITPFIAGMGFTKFADTIKKLQGLVGGNKTQENIDKTLGDIEKGLTSRPARPVAASPPGPPPPPPRPPADDTGDATPSPTGNPLLSLSRVLSLMQSGATPSAAAPAAADAPAVVGKDFSPLAGAATAAAAAPAASSALAMPDILALLGLA
jgi:hypothetical protein